MANLSEHNSATILELHEPSKSNRKQSLADYWLKTVTDHMTVTDHVTVTEHMTVTDHVIVTDHMTVTDNMTVTDHMTVPTVDSGPHFFKQASLKLEG